MHCLTGYLWGGFFKTAYKVGKPFLIFSVVAFFLIMIAETLHHIPGLEFLNATDTLSDTRMWLILLAALIVYILVSVMSLKASVRRFEAVDM